MLPLQAGVTQIIKLIGKIKQAAHPAMFQTLRLMRLILQGLPVSLIIITIGTRIKFYKAIFVPACPAYRQAGEGRRTKLLKEILRVRSE